MDILKYCEAGFMGDNQVLKTNLSELFIKSAKLNSKHFRIRKNVSYCLTEGKQPTRKGNLYLNLNLKAALYGIFVGRWQHTFPKIGGNISSIDKTGSAYYRSPRKKLSRNRAIRPS